MIERCYCASDLFVFLKESQRGRLCLSVGCYDYELKLKDSSRPHLNKTHWRNRCLEAREQDVWWRTLQTVKIKFTISDKQ